MGTLFPKLNNSGPGLSRPYLNAPKAHKCTALVSDSRLKLNSYRWDGFERLDRLVRLDR